MVNNGKVKIMDIDFFNGRMADFLEEDVIPALVEKEKRFYVTANPEIVMATRKDADYRAIVQSASAVVPDGIGVLLAAKWKGTPLTERIAGYDVFREMLALANERQASCYFLGAAEDVNQALVEKVKILYPTIEIAGSHHGYIDVDDEEVAEELAATNPDFVFVALGFPKQEKWIARYQSRFEKGIFIGLGGSFDVLAGRVKRAPDVWINLHLEWLYRLVKQPSRWKRMLPLLYFLWLSVWKK